jgi:hypothetical protein
VADHWLALLPMIRTAGPVDIDPLIAPARAVRAARTGFPCGDRCGPPPSATLWQQAGGDHSCIGVRVLRPLADAAPVALRLAAAAVERQVVPIILRLLAPATCRRSRPAA